MTVGAAIRSGVAVSFDGAEIEFDAIGSGPPLLLVPGGPRASAYLEDVGGLDRYRTLIRYDARGTGRTPAPDRTDKYAYPSLARDVDAIRAAIGVEQIDVLGHSAGATVAATYAGHHPDRIAGLILVAPGPDFFGGGADLPEVLSGKESEPWYGQVAQAAADLTAFGPDTTPDQIFDALERYTPAAYGRWGERQQAHAASQREQFSLEAWQHFRGHERTEPERFLPTLAGVTAPVLVLTGSADALTGNQVGEVVAGLFPNARHTVIPGAGHYPWVDVPDAFVEALTEHLALGRHEVAD